jgi:hypothetical protein
MNNVSVYNNICALRGPHQLYTTPHNYHKKLLMAVDSERKETMA